MIEKNPTIFDSWLAGVDELSACMDIGSTFVGARVPTDFLNELRDLAEWHNEQIEVARELYSACKKVEERAAAVDIGMDVYQILVNAIAKAEGRAL